MNESIERFFTSPAFAVVGVSRDEKKFGNTLFREMNKHSLTVYPVNPHLATIEGVKCYATISGLPEEVQSVVIVVHPEDTQPIVAECKQKGIHNIWLQQGAESDEAIAYAREHDLNLLHKQCVLMLVEPVKSIHALHRWVDKILHKYPV